MGKRKCNKCWRHLHREVPYEGHKCPYRFCNCTGCHPRRKCADMGPSRTKRGRPRNVSYQYQLSVAARNQPIEQERNRERRISRMLMPPPFNPPQPSNDSSFNDISSQRRLHVEENQHTLAQGLFESRKQELSYKELVTNIRNEVQGGANADNKVSAISPPRLFFNYVHNPSSSNSSVSHHAVASKVQMRRSRVPGFMTLAHNFKRPVQTSSSALKAVAGPSYVTQGTSSSGKTGNLPSSSLYVRKKRTLSFLEAAEGSNPEANSAKNSSSNQHFNRMQGFVPRNLFIKRANQGCLFQNSMPAQKPRLFRVNCLRPSNPKSNLEATSPQSTSISSSSQTVGNWPCIFHHDPSKDTRLLINTIDNLKTVALIQQSNCGLSITDNSQSVKSNEPTSSSPLYSSILISSPTDHSYVSVQRPNSHPSHPNNNPLCKPKMIHADNSVMPPSKSDSTSVPSTNINCATDLRHRMPSFYSTSLSDPVSSISLSLSNRILALEKNKMPTCHGNPLEADRLLPTSQDNAFAGDCIPVLEKYKMQTCHGDSSGADRLLPTSQDNAFAGDCIPVLEKDKMQTCHGNSSGADRLLPTSQGNAFAGDCIPVLEKDKMQTCQDNSFGSDKPPPPNKNFKPEETISKVSGSNLFNTLYSQWESCTQAFWEVVDSSADEMDGLSINLNSVVTEFFDEFDQKANTDDNLGLRLTISGDSFCDFENNHDDMAILAMDDSRCHRKFHSSSCCNTKESPSITSCSRLWIRLRDITLQFKRAREDMALLAALFPDLPSTHYVLTFLSCGGKFFPTLEELVKLVKTKRLSPSLDRKARALCRAYVRKDQEYRKALKKLGRINR